MYIAEPEKHSYNWIKCNEIKLTKLDSSVTVYRVFAILFPASLYENDSFDSIYQEIPIKYSIFQICSQSILPVQTHIFHNCVRLNDINSIKLRRRRVKKSINMRFRLLCFVYYCLYHIKRNASCELPLHCWFGAWIWEIISEACSGTKSIEP